MFKKIIIIATILILIGLVIFFLIQTKEKQEKLPVIFNQPFFNQELINNQVGLTNQFKELSPEEKLVLLKNELKIKARNFAERYGSFSTDALFANLRELKNEMSQNFWQQTENYIQQKEKQGQPTEFYGITTKVLNVQEVNFIPEQQLKFLISTQRQETKAQTTKVLYQNLELEMILEEGEWKIDKVNWL